MKVAVYQRVSTDKQDTAMQEHAITEWLSAHYPDAEITRYEDFGYSGKSDKRPAYKRLCADIESGLKQVVVVYRLDRLSRDAVTALRLLLDWCQAGVEFFAVAQPVLSLGKTNPMRLTICTIFAELAQLEREVTVERVKAGLKAARARGVKLGAPPKITYEQREKIITLRNQGLTYKMIGRNVGVSSSAAEKIYKGAR